MSITNIKWNEFESYLVKLMDEQNIAGAAVAVSKNGETIYQKGFGYRDLESQKPVTPTTIFGIASISKSFTAMAIMQLADAGKLSVEDSVVKYLPELQLQGVNDMNTIKIKHLLSHTTGLPPVTRRQDIKTFDEHISFLNSIECEMLGEPGEYFSYANDAFLLLGAIIERLTGKLYRRHMTLCFLDKLAMNRSTMTIEEVMKFKNVSVPYVYKREANRHEKQAWPLLGTYEVGGGVRSNVLDLLKYGQVYVNQGKVNKEQFVSSGAIKQMIQPMYQIDRNSHYGFAVKVTPSYHGVTLVEHGGGQPGVSANFGFVPEEGLVVAVLTNVTGVPAANIWLAAVNTALHIPLESKRSLEPTYEATPDEIQRFVGIYESDEGSKVVVLWANNCLVVEINGEVYEAHASDKRSLVLKGKEFKNVIRFYFDKEGKSWAAFAGLRMIRRKNSYGC